jgi:2-C-methyl-D-erythritol 4-phosphate cytidylyltransferase
MDKVMAPLGGKPVLAWSVATFQQSPLVDQIVIVSSEKNIGAVRILSRTQNWSKVSGLCPGGKRRQDSVAAGLKLLADCEWVIIHDGARPFLTQEIIRQGLISAQGTGVAAAAVPVTDTIKLAGDDLVVINTPRRAQLWAAQTPQIFRRDILDSAYQILEEDVTDDASLAERLGYKVQLFEGSYDNIKITTPRDISLAEVLLKQHDP